MNVLGTGKSTMLKAVVAWARSKGELVGGMASTGLAANVYNGFETAHSYFKIPIIDDAEDLEQESDLQLELDKYKHRKELIQNTKVFIWDEIGSQHIRDIRAVFRYMNNFEGKILILAGNLLFVYSMSIIVFYLDYLHTYITGDNMQIAPVVIGGTREQIISSSIYCSEIISLLEVVKFTHILRLIGREGTAQADYANMTIQVGKGTYESEDILSHTPLVDEDPTRPSHKVLTVFRNVVSMNEKQTALGWLYPEGFDRDIMHTKAVLGITNLTVKEWNSTVQQLNVNEPITLLSTDSFEEVDDELGYLSSMIDKHVTDSFHDNDSPDHELILKVNDICILLRHYDQKNGFSNNSRVIVTNITHKTVRVRSLNDSTKYACLPRIHFEVKTKFRLSVKMTRRQFPLKLAYALTVNRCQGQQFDKVLFDIGTAPFAHGQLYVSISRVREGSNFRFYIDSENDNECIYTADDETLYPQTANVVYKKIIDSFEPTIEDAEVEENNDDVVYLSDDE